MKDILKRRVACLDPRELIQTRVALRSKMELSSDVMAAVRHSLRHCVEDNCTACSLKLLTELGCQRDLENLPMILTKLDPTSGLWLDTLLNQLPQEPTVSIPT